MTMYLSHIYKCPKLTIKPNVSNPNITQKIKETRGMIKNNINFEKLVTEPYILKNQDLVHFFKLHWLVFMPLSDFYSDEIAELCDVYGGFYNITIDEITYDICLYFYKFKNPELITREVIEKFKIIFTQVNFIENNILDQDYHLYQIETLKKNISMPKYLDPHKQHELCKSK